MLRRNFDFLAIGLILLGMAVVRNAPRVEQRIEIGLMRYQKTFGIPARPFQAVCGSQPAVEQQLPSLQVVRW